MAISGNPNHYNHNNAILSIMVSLLSLQNMNNIKHYDIILESLRKAGAINIIIILLVSVKMIVHIHLKHTIFECNFFLFIACFIK